MKKYITSIYASEEILMEFDEYINLHNLLEDSIFNIQDDIIGHFNVLADNSLFLNFRSGGIKFTIEVKTFSFDREKINFKGLVESVKKSLENFFKIKIIYDECCNKIQDFLLVSIVPKNFSVFTKFAINKIINKNN